MPNETYEYIYLPEHPKSHKDGCIYKHRYMMELLLGRVLDDDEIVHHKDEDRKNNNINNLEIKTNSKHISDHMGGEIKECVCPICNTNFLPKSKKIVYCSGKCSHRNQERIVWPTKEELENLVWEIPTTKIAKMIGVSDKAIDKRCKNLGIRKPGRGYWSKYQGDKC